MLKKEQIVKGNINIKQNRINRKNRGRAIPNFLSFNSLTHKEYLTIL